MAETGKTPDQKRAERLKAALRENLKRRKAQARGRSGGTASGPSTLRPRESGDEGPKVR